MQLVQASLLLRVGTVEQAEPLDRVGVDWRFISLRLINEDVDYDDHFPPGYEAGHTAGLKLLRVAAQARAEYGRGTIGVPVSGHRHPGLRHCRQR